ncbi:MAG: EamA family transporter RarD [Microbacterium sp.]
MSNALLPPTAPIPVVSTAGPRPSGTRGVAASVLASVVFATLFLIPDAFTGLDPFAVTGWRVIIALPIVALGVLLLGQWAQLRELLARIRRRPRLLGIIAIDGALFGLQLFLFAWGPITGNALAVSLGYFLLPLVLVLLGVLVYRERISGARGLAVALAAIGVLVAIVAGASISWATFAVAFGYPAYFMLRRRFLLDSPAALMLEMAVLAPVGIALALRPDALGAMIDHPANGLWAGLLGLLTAVGFTAYTLAQRALPMSLFGLLSYLEPILLVVASTLILGEALGPADLVSYGAIGLALVVLASVGLRRRSARIPRSAS